MMIYQTANVPESAQFGYWHDVICRHFVPADSRLERSDAFPATFSTNALGSYQISRLAAPRHLWTRTTENVRKAPHDEFLLSLKLSGSTCLGQGGREVVQQAGELALYDTGRPFSYLLDSDIVLLKIPRHEMEMRLPQAGRFAAAAFGHRSSVGKLASRLVRESLDLDVASSTAAAERMGDCLVDAVSAAIEYELAGEFAIQRSEKRLLDTVKAYVLSHLGNRALDTARVAGRHGISIRTLNRLFAAEGTTPMRWIWSQRLAACHTALSQHGEHRITDIAYDYGFADPSHFSRAFKAAYGLRPVDIAKKRP
ncbi:AraC family transcriptional regulator [Panacagrimonas perspica]|uniref:AraC family transcriptional regulator n=1 Tax=Panacagrimonas perspica TaxID=381431 RepID=A0A4S3K238_9GAMM|nr:helix-turn-helix domain-containing protein [Panacagrimonas perspica]TDU26384.1 AraC family transcriptional regulator [Panacagrimonas perspica]THD02022.1 hypothetical protein B1810_16110 [Panacagrimonas perspica]